MDPMHNLYQGTAKKIIKIWLELKILLPEQLIEIQERVDSVNAASNIGSIPRKKLHPLVGLQLINGKTGQTFFQFLH